MRINKLFSNLGICSRKETNKLIEENRVKVNGSLCKSGQWINEEDEILLDDKPLKEVEKVYIAFNKPVGVTCTAEKSDKNNIVDYINYPQYIFPVGRLDKDSEGLIILTNDGELSNHILECDNNHEKEYTVKVDKQIDTKFIDEMRRGVDILTKTGSGVKRISDTQGIIVNNGKKETIILKEISNTVDNTNRIKTRECKVEKIDDNEFNIILTQGLNRQIRKMSGALGYKVTKLKRIRIMNIYLDHIKTGEYRKLTKEEVDELKNS